MSATATMTVNPTDEGYVLEIERLLKAPQDKVFAAWTDPGQLAQWWGPHGMTCPVCEWDPVVGARYRTCMESANGDRHCVGGVFEEVDAPHRLVFTWKWENDTDPEATDTRVIVELTAEGESTRLRLRHERMPSEESANNHNDGWSSSFEDLDAFLKN